MLSPPMPEPRKEPDPALVARHVWADGALVCNCGAVHKGVASSTAPPGWPGVASEPICPGFEAAEAAISETAPQRPRWPFLEIHSPDGEQRTTQIVLDGEDITRLVRAVTMRLSSDSLPQAEIELCFPRLDVRTRADVTFTVRPPDGYVVVEEPQLDGGKRWRTERERLPAREPDTTQA